MLGEVKENNKGTKMKIIAQRSNGDIDVEFLDNYHYVFKHAKYQNFKNGSIKNPFDKTVFEKGYLGDGKFSGWVNGEHTEEYEIWKGIIKRCYCEKQRDVFNSYYNISEVCDEWLNFQNFAEWWEENYYNCNNEMMCLDKDILYKKNNLYSPETCIIVPERINKLFIKQQRKRGKYPIGVQDCYDKRCDYKYLSVRLSVGEMKYLGNFPLNRPFQAFYTYKIYKENYIKQVADEYKDLIPKRLYDTMYSYEVEIND